MVIGITQPLPTEDAWSALFSNLSKSDLDNYVVKRSKRPLLEEVSSSRLPCPISMPLPCEAILLSENGSLLRMATAGKIWAVDFQRVKKMLCCSEVKPSAERLQIRDSRNLLTRLSFKYCNISNLIQLTCQPKEYNLQKNCFFNILFICALLAMQNEKLNFQRANKNAENKDSRPITYSKTTHFLKQLKSSLIDVLVRCVNIKGGFTEWTTEWQNLPCMKLLPRNFFTILWLRSSAKKKCLVSLEVFCNLNGLKGLKHINENSLEVGKKRNNDFFSNDDPNLLANLRTKCFLKF